MQNSEHQIALLKDVDYRFLKMEGLRVNASPEFVWNTNVMIVKYDLYMTDKRMVWDYRVSYPFAWSSTFKSAIGKTSDSEIKQTEEHFMGFIALDDLLQRNKENFEIRYEDVERIRLRKVSGNVRIFTLKQKEC